jgi:hypothetical protein
MAAFCWAIDIKTPKTMAENIPNPRNVPKNIKKTKKPAPKKFQRRGLT